MEEIWKDIPDSDGRWSVSSLGRTRTNWITIVSRGKTYKVYKEKINPHNNSGYQRGPNGEYLHRLVARLFIPNPNGYDQVHHIDRDKSNNAVDNLEWIDSTEHQHLHKCGVPFTEGHKQKLSGWIWINDGVKNRKLFEFQDMPEGFIEGRLQYTKPKPRRRGYHINFTKERNAKVGEAIRGLHWFNNGVENLKARECPEGYVPGRIGMDWFEQRRG